MTPRSDTVLVVDDDPAVRRLLSKWLSADGYQVAEAADGVSALAAIEASCPHFLLTDWEMPGGVSGLELCRHVRQACLPHYVYTVMLTGRDDAEDIVQALRTGADDFARKPVERMELLARMQAGARIVELEHRLSFFANCDPLTGVASKRMFDEHFEREWRRARRYGARLSCVMLDIDFFTRINNMHGHPAGDEVLRTIGRVLVENTRSTDFVGRVGGEEFCVLLTETDEENAVVWAERVRAKIAETPVTFDGKALGATASFGVAQFTTDNENAAQLFKLADRCLLAAKHAGRNRVLSYVELHRIGAACRDPNAAAGAVFSGVTARDVMTPIVAALPSDTTIDEAVTHLSRQRYNAAPVVDEAGRLAGFLSEKDVMNVLLWPDCWTRRVSDVMTTKVVCFDEAEPLLTIYEFLCRFPIRSVVVARDGRPTGIIGRGALLGWFSDATAAARAKSGSAGAATAIGDGGRLSRTTTATAP